jgi:hypothetical protein
MRHAVQIARSAVQAKISRSDVLAVHRLRSPILGVRE